MTSAQRFVNFLYVSAILYVVTISEVYSNTTNQSPESSTATTAALSITTSDDKSTTSTYETTPEMSSQPSHVTTSDQITTTEATDGTTESEETTSPESTTASPQNTSTIESSTESPTETTTEELNTTSTTETITTQYISTTQDLNITTSEAPVPTSTQEADNTTAPDTSDNTTIAPDTSDNTTIAPDTSSPQTSDYNLTTEASISSTVETTQSSIASTSSNDVTTDATTGLAATTQPVIVTTKHTYQVEPIYPSIENAVLELKFVLIFNGCSHNKTTIESKLSSVSGNIKGCEYLRVQSIKSCSNGRRKRSTSASQVSVDTVFGIDAQVGMSSGSNISTEMYTSLSTVESIDLTYLNDSISNVTNALTSRSICDSDSCKGALIGRPGFVCVNETFNNKQRCAILYYCDHQPIDCGKHGQCYVETDVQSTSYVSKCRCNMEDYFRYEGARCTEKVLTWELAVIICASVAGVLIIILLCIIVALCCRNSSNSADVSFEESELIYSPSGITSTNHYKNGVENRGYMEVRETSASGSWKPEDSANT